VKGATMKINQEYLKGLLEAFQSAEKPTTDIRELEQKGFSYQKPEFIFHLQILSDQHLVVRESGVGLGYSPNGGWVVTPLRLTAQGHEFIEALNNSQVWETIKTEFSEASIGTLWKVSKELLEAYTKKKITSLLNVEL
jgi:Hypothetical protein (DUF2513)